MFKTMNKDEMMKTNGGVKYIPYYENGEYKGLIAVSSNNPIQRLDYYCPWLPEYGDSKNPKDLIW